MTTPEKWEHPEKTAATPRGNWRPWLIGGAAGIVIGIVVLSSSVRREEPVPTPEKSEECDLACFEARVAERKRQRMAEELDRQGFLD